jgi:hypothetical protein
MVNKIILSVSVLKHVFFFFFLINASVVVHNLCNFQSRTQFVCDHFRRNNGATCVGQLSLEGFFIIDSTRYL